MKFSLNLVSSLILSLFFKYFMIMSNIARPGSKSFMVQVNDLIRRQNLGIIFLMKPRIGGACADKVVKEIILDGSNKIEAQGFASRIWMLWSTSNYQVTIL